jgi:DNA-binding PadR family transcriptional regulator
MNLGRVLVRIKQARMDGEELRRLSRDVGRELPRGRLEILRELRSGLASSNSEVLDPFARGYRAALDDLLAASEAAITPAQEARVAADVVKLRPQLQQVLCTFLKGSQRLTDVARELNGSDKSLVSRWLYELRNLGLLELYAQDAASAREKPYRLTERGRQVLERRKQGLSEESSALLRLATELFSLLAHEGRVLRSTFQELAEEVLEKIDFDTREVCDVIIKEAQGKGLLEDVNEVLVERFDTAADIVQGQLESALANESSHLPPALELLSRELPAQTIPIIVTSKGRDSWNRFVVQCKSALSAKDALANLQVVTWADLQGGFALPVTGKCALVFESGTLASGKARELAESSLEKQPIERFVFVTDTEPRISDVRPLVISPRGVSYARA